MQTELTEPPTQADEISTLRGFLDYYRDVIRRKTEGIDAEGMRATVGPSDLTLGGLLKHLAQVEDGWLGSNLSGDPIPEPWRSAPWDQDPDWELHSAANDSPEYLRELFDGAVETSERNLEVALLGGGLDGVAQERRGERFSLRWVLVHLIEEYARHAGHADLLREAVDGAKGD